LEIFGQVAQMVEQWTENPCVGGSIPSLSTNMTHLASLRKTTLSAFQVFEP
jgi:hypothetical protein